MRYGRIRATGDSTQTYVERAKYQELDEHARVAYPGRNGQVGRVNQALRGEIKTGIERHKEVVEWPVGQRTAHSGRLKVLSGMKRSVITRALKRLRRGSR